MTHLAIISSAVFEGGCWSAIFLCALRLWRVTDDAVHQRALEWLTRFWVSASLVVILAFLGEVIIAVYSIDESSAGVILSFRTVHLVGFSGMNAGAIAFTFRILSIASLLVPFLFLFRMFRRRALAGLIASLFAVVLGVILPRLIVSEPTAPALSEESRGAE